MIFLVALLVALEFAVVVFLFALFIRRDRSLNIFRRLRRHVDDDPGRFQQKEDFLKRAFKLLKRIAKPLGKLGFARNLDYKLKQAGIPLFGAEFVIVSIIGAVLGSTLIYVITLNTRIAPFAGLTIPLLMWLWVMIRVSRRQKAFTEQLGDCLTTVANALRAGYSFQQAMDVVAREMEPPMSTEFERMSTDVAMGVSLEDAMEQMNRRVGSADFDLVVTAVLIQREIGGNLAQILDTISETIQERIRMKREIKALTAQGRFSAWVLLMLPFVMALFCWVFNGDQMRVFVDEEAGRIAIAVAIFLELLGFIIIQRIVNIEV